MREPERDLLRAVVSPLARAYTLSRSRVHTLARERQPCPEENAHARKPGTEPSRRGHLLLGSGVQPRPHSRSRVPVLAAVSRRSLRALPSRSARECRAESSVLVSRPPHR